MIRITKPSNRVLAVFVSVSLGLHVAAIWFAELPDHSPGPPSRHPALRVAIEVPSTSNATDEKPGKVEVASEPRQPPPLERGRPSTGRRPEPRESTSKGGEPNAVPRVNARELLQDMDPRDEPSAPDFGARPETHRIFRPQRLVRAPEPAAPWSSDIWRRTAVRHEDRFRGVGGRSVLIRKFDNGDIQICDRPRDDLMDPLDDHLPYACER